jgi:hypothetical protein
MYIGNAGAIASIFKFIKVVKKSNFLPRKWCIPEMSGTLFGILKFKIVLQKDRAITEDAVFGTLRLCN